MPRSFSPTAVAFMESCESQGAPLRPDLCKRLEETELLPEDPNYTSPLVELTRLLALGSNRVQRAEQATLKPLNLEAIQTLGLAAFCLGIQVNAQHNRPVVLPNAWQQPTGTVTDYYSTCYQANWHWEKIYEDIANQGLAGCSAEIFVDGDTPTVMRKGHKYPTGLTLQNIGQIPAGSIVCLDSPSLAIRPVRHEDEDALQLPPEGYKLTPFREATALRFVRTSPFALTVDQRAEHFGTDPLLASVPNIETFRQTVTTAVANHMA